MGPVGAATERYPSSTCAWGRDEEQSLRSSKGVVRASSTLPQRLRPVDRKGMEIAEKPTHRLPSISLLFHLCIFRLKDSLKGVPICA
jgi:hypothetical protein